MWLEEAFLGVRGTTFLFVGNSKPGALDHLVCGSCGVDLPIHFVMSWVESVAWEALFVEHPEPELDELVPELPGLAARLLPGQVGVHVEEGGGDGDEVSGASAAS